MQISEGVIHLSLWPRWIPPSSICIILHFLLSLIHSLLINWFILWTTFKPSFNTIILKPFLPIYSLFYPLWISVVSNYLLKTTKESHILKSFFCLVVMLTFHTFPICPSYFQVMVKWLKFLMVLWKDLEINWFWMESLQCCFMPLGVASLYMLLMSSTQQPKCSIKR